jgi:proline iminopeptidase
VLFTGLGPDLTQYNYYDRLKEINIPTLIIHGMADAIPMEVQQRANENLSKSQLTLFKYSGHFPFIEEPEHFRKEVVAFLLKK